MPTADPITTPEEYSAFLLQYPNSFMLHTRKIAPELDMILQRK